MHLCLYVRMYVCTCMWYVHVYMSMIIWEFTIQVYIYTCTQRHSLHSLIDTAVVNNILNKFGKSPTIFEQNSKLY